MNRLTLSFLSGLLVASSFLGCASNNQDTSLAPQRPVDFLTLHTSEANDQHSPISLVSHSGSLVDDQQKYPVVKTLQSNEDIFEIVRRAKGPILIDFYADWCGPCQRQAVVLEQVAPIAAENEGWIIKVNVDQHEKLANRFHVQALPTLMLVKDGMIVDRRSGLASEEKLAELLKR